MAKVNLFTKWLAASRYFWQTLDNIDRFFVVAWLALLTVTLLVWLIVFR